MARARSVSVGKLTSAVQAAVKEAVKKHPKFAVGTPKSIVSSYLIRGIPVPEAILANISVREVQAFADDVAAQIGKAQPEVFAAARVTGKGAILSAGGHIIIGIPASMELVNLTK